MFKANDQWQASLGLQRQIVNVNLYFGKAAEPDVKTITPYAELLYYINDKTSLRIETQYMHNKHDIGSWIYGLAELGISPHWLFELSGMYNTFHPKDGKNYFIPLQVLYIILATTDSAYDTLNRFRESYVLEVYAGWNQPSVDLELLLLLLFNY